MRRNRITDCTTDCVYYTYAITNYSFYNYSKISEINYHDDTSTYTYPSSVISVNLKLSQSISYTYRQYSLLICSSYSKYDNYLPRLLVKLLFLDSMVQRF